MHSTAAARTQELVLGLAQTCHRDTLSLRQELITLLRRAIHSTLGAGRLPIRIASWCPLERATAQPPPILGAS